MDNILLALMLLPPLAAAAINGASLYAGDRWLGWRQVQGLTLAACGIAAAAALVLLALRIADPVGATVVGWDWFRLGGAAVEVAFRLDPLGAVMAALVAGFGFVICRFSINYMHNETGFTRYFMAYGLFVAAMLVLVLADNLVLMFLGWEAVGLCSYLLIGHYARRPAAAAAATEAFVANRVGDAGLILGILILGIGAGTVRFADLPEAIAAAEPWVAPAAALCLLVGALGKSAQVPLGGWLAKAMEGPTPSSALIHAATMVTAGVYLVVRAHPVFEAAPAVLVLVGLFGALSALYGALAGQAASDIKGVLASSTTMHLGLMFVLCGLGAYAAAIFYLVAHAFYKAYKFLTAPSILHHVHGRGDFAPGPVTAELPAGGMAALVVAVVLLFLPPVAALTGHDLGLTLTLAAFAGSLVLALVLTARAAAQALDGGHGHGHAHDHGHDHGHHDHDHTHDHGHHDHGHAHGHAHHHPAPAGLGPMGAAALSVAATAVLAAAVQVLPGGASWTWFGAFLGLAPADPAAAAPGPALLLSLALALLAAHSVLSAGLLARGLPEAAAARPVLRGLHAMAINRLWVDALVLGRLVPLVLRLSAALGRLDLRLTRALMQGGARLAERTGDAVGWLDTVPRRAAEDLPGAIGLNLAEASRAIEARATTGVESGMNRVTRALGRGALVLERALGRPAVSVALILIVALIALAGA